MYYSVPTLRRASYLNMDVPAFQAAASAGPSDMETDESSSNGSQGSTVVRRQSRVSTECHPDYLFTEFYGSMNADGDDTDVEDDDSDAEEDFLMAIIEARAALASSSS